MRLIDADALKRKAFGGRNGLVHTSDIDEAQTIAAIPVEWLNNRREGLIFAAMTHSTVYGDNTIELCHAINMVLDMWQEEQEAR